MTATSRLDAATRAVCPIDGVSVDAATDPPAVRIDYRPEATADQRAAAEAAVAAFDWSDTAQQTWEAGQNAAAAGALLASGESVPRAVRASDAVGYELRNNAAETLGALIEVLTAQLGTDLSAAVVARIAARRADRTFAETPPAAADAFASGTERVQRDQLLPLVGAAVAAGV